MSSLMGDASVSLKSAIKTACIGLVDREPLVELIVLAAVAREHLLVLGPAGTGKSQAVRRVAEHGVVDAAEVDDVPDAAPGDHRRDPERALVPSLSVHDAGVRHLVVADAVVTDDDPGPGQGSGTKVGSADDVMTDGHGAQRGVESSHGLSVSMCSSVTLRHYATSGSGLGGRGMEFAGWTICCRDQR